MKPAASVRGQQVRQREQAALAGAEHEQVLHGLVRLAILEFDEPIAVVALQQHPHEGMQKVQVLRSRPSR